MEERRERVIRLSSDSLLFLQAGGTVVVLTVLNVMRSSRQEVAEPIF